MNLGAERFGLCQTLRVVVDIDDAARATAYRRLYREHAERLSASPNHQDLRAGPLPQPVGDGAKGIGGTIGKSRCLRQCMPRGLPDQHVIGERHANEIGQPAAIFDAGYRFQPIG